MLWLIATAGLGLPAQLQQQPQPLATLQPAAVDPQLLPAVAVEPQPALQQQASVTPQQPQLQTQLTPAAAAAIPVAPAAASLETESLNHAAAGQPQAGYAPTAAVDASQAPTQLPMAQPLPQLDALPSQGEEPRLAISY